MLAMFLAACSGKPANQPAATPPAVSHSAPDKPAEAESNARAAAAINELLSMWNYTDSKDDMTDKVMHQAVKFSENTVNFDFPYQGDQRGALAIAMRKGETPVVLFFIEKGQIQCELDQCTMQVRFDDHPAESWRAIPPADHSTTRVFLADGDRFLKELMASKRILIGVGIYQNGFPTFHFDVSGLDSRRISTF